MHKELLKYLFRNVPEIGKTYTAIQKRAPSAGFNFEIIGKQFYRGKLEFGVVLEGRHSIGCIQIGPGRDEKEGSKLLWGCYAKRAVYFLDIGR